MTIPDLNNELTARGLACPQCSEAYSSKEPAQYAVRIRESGVLICSSCFGGAQTDAEKEPLPMPAVGGHKITAEIDRPLMVAVGLIEELWERIYGQHLQLDEEDSTYNAAQALFEYERQLFGVNEEPPTNFYLISEQNKEILGCCRIDLENSGVCIVSKLHTDSNLDSLVGASIEAVRNATQNLTAEEKSKILIKFTVRNTEGLQAQQELTHILAQYGLANCEEQTTSALMLIISPWILKNGEAVANSPSSRAISLVSRNQIIAN